MNQSPFSDQGSTLVKTIRRQVNGRTYTEGECRHVIQTEDLGSGDRPSCVWDECTPREDGPQNLMYGRFRVSNSRLEKFPYWWSLTYKRCLLFVYMSYSDHVEHHSLSFLYEISLCYHPIRFPRVVHWLFRESPGSTLLNSLFYFIITQFWVLYFIYRYLGTWICILLTYVIIWPLFWVQRVRLLKVY